MLTQTTGWKRTYTLTGSLLILVLLVTTGVGLLGSNIYDPFSPPKYVQESRAQDLITLVLGIPLLIIAMRGIHHEKRWAFPLGAGVLAYELYVYAIYTVGGIYNSLFPGYVMATSLSLYMMIGVLSSVNLSWFVENHPASPRRWTGVFFGLIVVVFCLIWIGDVMNSIETGQQADGHLIFVFDLVIVLPAFGIAAVQLFQGRAFGDLLAGVLLIKFITLCLSITLGQIFRAITGIKVESELLSIFIPLGLISLGFAIVYFRQLASQGVKTE